MNQEKIGKFIASLRKEQKLTQEALAEKLGVTAKSVSRWENGQCLPDVSLYKDICNIFGITLNDFFAGEKITAENFKEQADTNLFSALENSSFTLKEKVNYFATKWDKEHLPELILVMITIVGFIIYGFIKDNGLQYIFMLIGFLCGIVENNRKQAYIEKNAYNQIKPNKEE